MKITSIQDIGDTVICDICNDDYTNSEAEGGFLFGSYGYCPDCAKEKIGTIKKYNEEEYIKERADEGETFKDFIMRIRGGDNRIITGTF